MPEPAGPDGGEPSTRADKLPVIPNGSGNLSANLIVLVRTPTPGRRCGGAMANGDMYPAISEESDGVTVAGSQLISSTTVGPDAPTTHCLARFPAIDPLDSLSVEWALISRAASLYVGNRADRGDRHR